MCYLCQASGQKDRPEEERGLVGCYESTEDADQIRGAHSYPHHYQRYQRPSIYQKKTDESADIDYNVVALDCVSSD